jgi:type IV secretion system protein VirB4
MMHVDAVRREARTYSGTGAFPDRTTGLIDAERRAQYEAEGAHFETTYILCITFLPPADNEDKLSEFFVEGDKAEDSPSARAMRTFKAGIQDLEDTLSLSLRFRRLRAHKEIDERGNEYVLDDFLRHLTHCVTGVDHPVRLPDVPMYIDAMIGATDFFGGLKPRVGELSVRTLSITGFPNESFPGILDGLNRMSIPFRWSNRFIFMDPFDARKHLETRRKKWFTGRKSLRGVMAEQSGGGPSSINNDAARMAEDAQEAIDELAADVVRYGFYTSTVVLMHEDPSVADERAREVLKVHPDLARRRVQPGPVRTAAEPAARVHGHERLDAVPPQPARGRRRPHADPRPHRRR